MIWLLVLLCLLHIVTDVDGQTPSLSATPTIPSNFFTGNQTVLLGGNATFTCGIFNRITGTQFRNSWLIVFNDGTDITNILYTTGGTLLPPGTDASLFYIRDPNPGLQAEFTILNVTARFNGATVTCFSGATALTGHIEIFATPTSELSGDPHFMVPLCSGDMLCYSIQGYTGLVFNLVTSPHLTVNAMFMDSVNDMTEATWISKVAVIPRAATHSVIFNSATQQLEIVGQGSLKASVVRQVSIRPNGQFGVKFTRGLVNKTGTNMIRVIYEEPRARFDVVFHADHLDLDWKIQDDKNNQSHGLLGQFMTDGISVDHQKTILIRPDHQPVPVDLGKAWHYDNRTTNGLPPCWHARNHGNQGEGLIDGTILDYVMPELLSVKL